MNSKWAVKSKTIIGVIIAALPTILPTLGVSYSVDDHTMISESVDKIFVALGSIVAIYGRFVATDRLKFW